MRFNTYWTFLLAALRLAHGATVQLGQTTLTGRLIPIFGQEFFGGIPYAEVPIGNRRLRPPALKTSLGVPTFDASGYGPSCMQPGLAASEPISEDCLTINVLRPVGTPANAGLPVVRHPKTQLLLNANEQQMFWTYGGGFDSGQSNIYNGSGIVGQSVLRGTPVIYVNFNYRIGPLGFPQGQEADNRGALNLGIKDQIAALKWVQANIGAFGGDKRKVMAFGESAGAIMTAILFLNGHMDGLARAAVRVLLSPGISQTQVNVQILESGSPNTAALFTPERREISWQDFVGGVSSCASLATSMETFACLRSLPPYSPELLAGYAASLAEEVEEFPWDPVLDGPLGLIPDLPSVLYAEGRFSKIPFMAGTNLDEGTPLLKSKLYDQTHALFVPSVSPKRLNASLDEMFVLYPDDPAQGSPFGTGDETFGLSPEYKRGSAMLNDLDFLGPRREFMKAAAAADVPAYGYHFTQPQPGVPPQLGVYHSSEIKFVYGAPPDPSLPAQTLSRIMTDYWISFAVSLTPNDGRGIGIPRPTWTPWTPASQRVMQLNAANLTMVGDDFRATGTDFINSDPVIWRH
ncbi:Carboxylic ester hydrolase [Mycena kentingensis (nom. inval.)]|nr:Carboxylic ester hydrolase [Mycena kentingensis (nom. inval.)]